MKPVLRLGMMLLLTVLLLALAGCGPTLPPDARRAVLRRFDPEEEVHIHRVQQVTPLPEDLEAGAEEVWCVSLTFTCWSCAYGEFRTCSDSRLVRRIDDHWEVSLLFTEEDKAQYEARGCELMVETVGR